MKAFLLAGLLLSGLASCGSNEDTDHLQVSTQQNTWLEVDKHWTGAFSGWQHDEYLVSYVRKGWWWQEDERVVLAMEIQQPEIKRINANTIDIIRSGPGMRPIRLTFTGIWPAVQKQEY